MQLSSPFAYHSLRLASDRRWANGYRAGRAAAVAEHGLGYGEPLMEDQSDAMLLDGPKADLLDFSAPRPARRREQTRQG